MPAAEHHDDGRRLHEVGCRRRVVAAGTPGEGGPATGPVRHVDAGAGPTVRGLGEAGVLAVVGRELAVLEEHRPWPAGSVGIGDDAALLPPSAGGTLVSTDAMAEGHDWLPTWPAGVRTRGFDVGWKAAAQNLSDINAMGGVSTALVTALTGPPETEVAWVRGVARGLAAALLRLGADECRVAGGDLGAADRAGLTVTVLGRPGGHGVLRRTMGEQDLAAVRRDGGTLVHAGTAPGWAAAGLALMFTDRAELEERWRALSAAERPSPRALARAVRAQLRPRPPLTAGPAAAGSLACGMDVSDGLGRDAGRLAEANGLQLWADEAWLAEVATPLRGLGRLLDVAPEDWVLGGGEDYGLLAVLRPGHPVPAGFRTIGAVPSSGSGLSGHRRLDGTGWDHFS
ncbi:thiamine-phosphate kinase [Micrococcus luteus]